MHSDATVDGEPDFEPIRDADHDLNNRLFFRLFQASNIYHRQATSELSISAVQGAVLGALSRYGHEGISFSALVDYLAVSRQNLDAVLKRLERTGYVERIESPTDRRVRLVRLTRAGTAAWDDLGARTVEFFRQATAALSREAKATFVESLVQVSRGLKGARLDAQPVAKAARAGRATKRSAARSGDPKGG